MSDYEQQAKVTKIVASSKATVKIRDNYYSFSYEEERELPEDQSKVNIEKERELLWETLNGEVDKQIDEIVKMYK